MTKNAKMASKKKNVALKVRTDVRAGMNKGDLVNSISMPTLQRH